MKTNQIAIKVVMGVTFIVCAPVYAYDATITQDDLVHRRSSKSIDDVGILAARYALRDCFNILVSHELYPTIQTEPFPFTISSNGRLVGALNNLTEATDGLVRWHLLKGRIILTVLPPELDAGPPIGDRVVRVDIQGAETLHEALLQLEEAYNEQYRDIPWLVALVHMTYVAAYLPFETGAFSLNAEKPVREIIIDIMDALEEKRTHYYFTRGYVPRHWDFPSFFTKTKLK